MTLTLPLAAVSRPQRTPLARLFGWGERLFGRLAQLSASRPPRGARVIEVTSGQARQLAASFESARRRPPTAVELRRLIDELVKEEIYYREALALGLDHDDPVIRRRLRQKMELLAASRADVLKPTEAQLRAHFLAHRDRFAPARLSFAHVFLGAAPADEEVGRALASLARGADPRSLGRPSELPSELNDAAEPAVDQSFGPGFFARAASLAPQAWSGPVRSAHGLHLVRVAGPAAVEAFETMREAIEKDWRRRAAVSLEQRVFRRYRKRYRISRPDASPVPAR
jgi:hypothetical protein